MVATRSITDTATRADVAETRMTCAVVITLDRDQS
jgi:hypothetical protein